MYKKITLFALFISIIGIILGFYRDYNSILFNVLDFFSYNIFTGQEIFWINGNYLRVIFSVTLFIGAIAFYKSKEKETRILRFAFSTLFVEICVFVPLRLYFISAHIKSFALKDYALSFVSLALMFFVAYFLYKSMEYLNKSKALDYETFVYTESTEIAYFKTNNWQRLFHFVFDTIIFGILGFQILYVLIRTELFNGFFETLQTQLNPQLIFTLFVVVFRTLFYFTFETLFQASPAKFLTESLVVNDEGLKVPAGTIFKRTLSRSIPFDSVSFLLKADWHDSFSFTEVYKEKKTGLQGSYYFLIIPLLAVFLYGMHLWEVKKEKDMYYEGAIKTFEGKNANITEGLKTIDTNTVLQLKNDDYSSRTKFLKVENVSNSTIEFSVLNLENESYQRFNVEKGYETSKDTLKKVKIKRADLQKMVLSDFKQSSDYNESDKINFEGIAAIPELKGKYIEYVLALHSPNLQISDSNFDANGVSLYLENKGIPAEVISVASNDKNINWNLNMLPKRFAEYGSVFLRGEGKDISGYKLRVTINDSLNKKFIYEISSTENPKSPKVRLIK
ncbi:RDD family protein [Flavobacterium sp. N1736]|uniref:RDD family protein n=1 Tax=Flavobacterium sp. N1736 TaxID=2986823 RepID=UPI002225A216|nr:RDD family protein [Flavobacterium sp. N1736]